MNRRFPKIFVIALIVCALAATLALVGCGSEDDSVGKKSHVVDPIPLGGENVLDDGGKINLKGSSFAFKGVEFDEAAEHKIYFDTDTAKFELFGGQKVGTWNNSDASFGRIQVTAATKGAIFTFDFSDVEDKSNIGCMVNLIACRGSVLFSVSTDKEHWLDIGFNQPTGIRLDASESVDELSGKPVKDKNLRRAYFLLGDYIGESDVLYFKAGFTKSYFQGSDSANNAIGADLIDHVAYYDGMKIVGDII